MAIFKSNPSNAHESPMYTGKPDDTPDLIKWATGDTSFYNNTDDDVIEDINAEAKAEYNEYKRDVERILPDRIDVDFLMNDFKYMINKLNNKFNSNRPLTTMYLRFELGNGDNKLIIDTTDPKWYTNTLINFQHNINGSGNANSFTLDIILKAEERIKNWNIYALEPALKNIYNDVSNSYWNCTYQYGYGDDLDLRTPVYEGMVLKYTSKIQRGNLTYRLTGFGSIYGPFKEMKLSSDMILPTTNNPLLYIKDIVENSSLGLGDQYEVKFVISESAFNTTSRIKYAGDEFPSVADKNLFEVISDILKGTYIEGRLNAIFDANGILTGIDGSIADADPTNGRLMDPRQISHFDYFFSETPSSSGKKTIFIYNVDPKQKSTYECDTELEFGYIGPSGKHNHLVKEWHPEFDGSVLMAMSSKIQKEGNGDISKALTKYTEDDNGNVVSMLSLGGTRIGNNGNEILQNMIQEFQEWGKKLQYPYTSQLELVGIPCEIPLTGKLKIIPKIYDQVHHSEGVYMFTKRTDTINSNGFWTNLELCKLVEGMGVGYISAEDFKNMYFDEDETGDAPDAKQTENVANTLQYESIAHKNKPNDPYNVLLAAFKILDSDERLEWWKYVSMTEIDYMYHDITTKEFNKLIDAGFSGSLGLYHVIVDEHNIYNSKDKNW